MFKRESFPFLKSVSRIFLRLLRNFKDVPFGSYVSMRYKHMPIDSYFYLGRHISKFMMSNLRGSVRTQNIITEDMSNSWGSSTDKSESKRVNANACLTDKIE